MDRYICGEGMKEKPINLRGRDGGRGDDLDNGEREYIEE